MALQSGIDMTTLQIDKTEFSVNSQGTPLKVMRIWWTAYLTQSGVTKYIPSKVTEIPTTYAPGQKAYATVTESD